MKRKLDEKIKTKTSNGVLSKGWFTEDGVTYLVKGNSVNLNSCKIGYEPFSEVLASNLAEVLGLRHVKYVLQKAADYPEIKTFDCDFVSVCERINTESQIIHFASFADALSGGVCKDYFGFLLKHAELQQDIYKMLAFDALIGNSDRHLNNIDVLFDGTVAIVSPILDNGAGFLALINDDKLSNWKSIGPDKAKPFKETHELQMNMFRKYFGDIHLCNKAITTIYNEWESLSYETLKLMSDNRRMSICTYFKSRLEHYSWMFGTSGFQSLASFK